MKTVFQNREIAHVWANQTDDELAAGREGRSNSMSFRGPEFRSYQTAIARVYVQKGRRAVLLDASSFSVTTSAHQSHVRQAIGDGVPVWRIRFGKRGQSLNFTAKELWAHACEEVRMHTENAANARGRAPYHLALAQGAVNQAEEIRQFFGLRNKPFAPDLSKLVAHAKDQTRINAEMEKNRERLHLEQVEKQKAYTAKNGPRMLALWRAHDEDMPEWRNILEGAQKLGLRGCMSPDLISTPDFQATAALRLSIHRDRVETSQGAQVLVRTVSFLWAFCRTAKAKGEAVAPDVIARFPRLDNYNASAIDARGNLTAGCHRIPFAEIEYIARELGLPPFDGSPAEVPSIPQNEEVLA